MKRRGGGRKEMYQVVQEIRPAVSLCWETRLTTRSSHFHYKTKVLGVHPLQMVKNEKTKTEKSVNENNILCTLSPKKLSLGI
jgi:hypothetical protein